jgi:histidinol dehydrogenase
MKIYRDADIDEFVQRFESRRSQVADDVERSVVDILKEVADRGDSAVRDYAERFDGVDLNRYGVQLTKEELIEAHSQLDPQLLDILRESRDNIARFHRKGLAQSWLSWEQDGVILGQRILPLEKVGVYVPGGLAAYPSSLLMGVVPAQVAGVEEIVITTPSDKNGSVNSTILAAAYELGIKRVFRIGGAHAIAALAFGTKSVPRVDKIVGPGNIFVATAKKLLYGQCGIDMVAGPSEVVVIADDSAYPDFTASDLLAQAEHDPLASAILLTDSASLAEEVQREVLVQQETLQRKEIISESWQNFGGIVLCHTIGECVDLCNRLAPEHLGLHIRDPWKIIGEIRNAGAVFLGHFSPEAVGDYWAGPNHVLPTDGSARFFSPLRTEDFLKSSSIISYTKQAMQKHGQKIVKFALCEGLDGHANAIRKRIQK